MAPDGLDKLPAGPAARTSGVLASNFLTGEIRSWCAAAQASCG